MSAEQKTILLVEDQAILAMSQKKILERRGYNVLVATSGEKAVDQAREAEELDLILMDIDLGPGIDGTEAAQEILGFRDVPVVFLSSHTEQEVVERTEKITSYGYIVKNSGETVLITSVNMAFKLYESRQQELATKQILAQSQNQIDYILNHDLKTVQEAFNRSEHRFATLMASIQDVVFTLDLEKKHTGVYGPWVSQAGLTAHYFLGRGFRDIYGSQDAQVHEEACAKALDGEYTLYEWSLPTPRGRKYYQTSLSPIFGQDGRVLELVGIGRDITHLIEHSSGLADQILQRAITTASEVDSITATQTFELSQKNHRSHPKDHSRYPGSSEKIIKNSQGVLQHLGKTKNSRFYTFRWKLEEKWPAVYVSPTIHLFLGYRDQDFYSGRILYKNLVHPDDRERTVQEVHHYLTQGIEEFTQEYRLVTKDNQTIWVTDHTWIHRDDQGNPEYLQGMLSDSTLSKKQELELIRSEARFRGILDSVSSLAVQGYDHHGNVKYWNRASEKFYGYTKNEALGKNLLDLIIPQEISGKVRAGISSMMHTGVAIPAGEIELKRKDGTSIQVYSSHVVVNTEESDPEFFCLDVNLEEQKAAQATIASLLREKDLILKEAHHRIKNNMAISINMLHLQAQMQEETHIRQVIDDAARRLQTMQTLYDTLYDSDQVFEVNANQFFTSLMEQIVSTFDDGEKVTHKISVDNLHIALRIASPLGIILNELVTNTMKHGFRTISSRQQPRVELFLGQKQKELVFEYRDNGSGIPAHISFDASSGFGMELIGRLVDQLEGTARIEPVEGTQIKIHIPSLS